MCVCVREREREKIAQEEERRTERAYLQQQQAIEHLEDLGRGLVDGAQHRLAAVRHRTRRLHIMRRGERERERCESVK